MCKLDPDSLLKKCLLEPIESLLNSHTFNFNYFFVIIDGLDNSIFASDQSNNSNPNQLAPFLLKHLNLFPKWFKFLITLRDEKVIVDKLKTTGGYHVISLDPKSSSSVFKSTNSILNDSEVSPNTKITHHAATTTPTTTTTTTHKLHFSTHLNRDLHEYIQYRIQKSSDIQKNILHFNCPPPSTSINSANSNLIAGGGANNHHILRSPDLNQLKQHHSSNNSTLIKISTTGTLPNPNKLDSNFQNKFSQHLIGLSESSYLFAKLTLDLIEKGNLVIKSSNFKVLPKNFDDLLKLYFNLKFQSRASYERLASHIFTILLASYRPLSLDEIYETLNCAYLSNEKISLNDLIDQIAHLDGFVNSFLYYDPDFDSLEAKLSSPNKSKLVRTSLYTFSHGAIRDWWSEYHTSLIKSQNPQQPGMKFKTEWAHFLLGSRLFRSTEFNHRLRGMKYPQNIRVILDQMRYLVKASSLLDAGLETVAYLLSLYLPVLSSSQGIHSMLILNLSKQC